VEHNFIENELVILTKQTLDIFLKQENPSELIALYTFYYYTAKWQQTNQIKCTTDYVAKGLHWNRHKVIKVKKQLIEFGLIEDARIVDENTKKVLGYYVKMNYVFKKTTLEKTQCAQNPPTGSEALEASVSKSDTLENEHTNALSDINLNALSSCNKEESKKNKVPKKEQTFNELIDDYTDNEDLRVELKEHLKTRKAKKGALTNHAIELSFKTLDSLAKTDKEKIMIVQQSIESGWTKFYAIKKANKQDEPETSYNIQEHEEMSQEDIFRALGVDV
jgi:hypothetical protein